MVTSCSAFGAPTRYIHKYLWIYERYASWVAGRGKLTCTAAAAECFNPSELGMVRRVDFVTAQRLKRLHRPPHIGNRSVFHCKGTGISVYANMEISEDLL